MKKCLLKCVLFTSVIVLLAGCTSKTNGKKMTCSATATQGNIHIKMHYEVTFLGEYVKTVKTEEELTSSDKNTLKGYKNTIEDVYKKYDDIDYYDYKIEMKDDHTLISHVSIDYDHVDIDKIVALSDSSDQLIKNGKVKLSDIKEVYENVGATCKFE